MNYIRLITILILANRINTCITSSTVNTEPYIFTEQKRKLQSDDKKIIAIIGTGYVGLVTGAGLAECGNTVICADINHEKIESLNKGIIPIYEPGLDELVKHNVTLSRLSFTHDVDTALSRADIIFIAVDTPMSHDGTADLRAVLSVVKAIAKNSTKYQVIVTKSTVPIGTGNLIKEMLMKEGLCCHQFDMVSNPEFLREGSAVQDFLNPDRIVIGSESTEALAILCSVYSTLIANNIPCVFTNLASAEMSKYASNGFLAVKISFINEIANLCDKVGADIKTVAHIMGLDKRISPLFLKPGPGFGGSCFPKDTQALLLIGQKHSVTLHTVKASLKTNERQSAIPIEKLLHLMNIEKTEEGCLNQKKIAIFGASFKANTDDIRYSPACIVMQKLIDLGANVSCYDPAAMNNASKQLPMVEFCQNPYLAINQADGIIIMTEWDEFKHLDWHLISRSVNQKIIVDARSIIKPEELKSLGFLVDMIGLSYACQQNTDKKPIPVYKIITI